MDIPQNVVILRDGTEQEPKESERLLADNYNLLDDTGVFKFLENNSESSTLNESFEVDNERGYAHVHVRTATLYDSRYRDEIHNAIIMDIVRIQRAEDNRL